ncbi:acyl-CoA thioesterase [Croceiramulus getboli]|nr:thioesterase family protein [Flavobacteriaceae bacterium YJPT1-3]
MKPRKFEYTLEVPKSAIDQLGHVNNVIYLQWVQDIAEAHWAAATQNKYPEYGTAMQAQQSEWAWVALNHYIAYKNPAYAGDSLQLETWVEQFSGVRSERHTLITRPSDQKLIAEAKTNWCLITLPQGKPKRVPEEIVELFFEDADEDH